MPISKVEFEGHKALELTTGAVRLIAVYDVGPRIAFFGKRGSESFLFWDPRKYIRKGWKLYGGHRVWVTRPEADETEETYAPDNDPAEVEMLSNGFRLTGAPDSFNCTRRGFEVRILSEDRLEVDNFIINSGDMLFSGGVWALTCTVPKRGTRYAFPIGDGSSWDRFNLIMFRAWGGADGSYNDPQISFTDDLMVVEPQGRVNKRMLLSHRGICLMDDPVRNLTFAKKVVYEPACRYPLNTNMAIYIGPDNVMVEMETMGAERTLKPGERAHNVETWVLKSRALGIKDAETLARFFE